MAWRKPNRDDLIATISQKEVDAFSRSAEWTEEPIGLLLDRTSAFVRMHIKSNGNVRMSPEDFTLPESLISPAMDYVAVDLLKRINMKIGEDRQKARSDALELFRAIAEGRITPESYGENGSESTGGAAVELVSSSRIRVSPENVEGL